MATVYSTQFVLALHACTGGADVVYTVPAGKVAVLRDLELLSTGSGNFMFVSVNGIAQIARNNSTVGGTTAQWTGRVVLNAGDTLEVNGTNLSSVRIVASGYLLNP